MTGAGTTLCESGVCGKSRVIDTHLWYKPLYVFAQAVVKNHDVNTRPATCLQTGVEYQSPRVRARLMSLSCHWQLGQVTCCVLSSRKVQSVDAHDGVSRHVLFDEGWRRYLCLHVLYVCFQYLSPNYSDFVKNELFE